MDEQAENFSIIITDEDRANYKRLDLFLAAKLENISRTTIKNLSQLDLINFHEDSPVQGKLELKKMPLAGAQIEVLIPPPLDSHLEPENIPLKILFEDEHLIVIVKPAGLVTHPAPGHPTGTLVHAILYHCPDLKGIGDTKRPGIVHRLDKGTSGVMVVAKNAKTHEGLINLFAAHDIKRQYQCLGLGQLSSNQGRLESTIGRHPQNRKKMAANVRGKRAVTHYERIESFHNIHHLKCTLETGRTHQIRVHLSQLLNCPLLMDDLYGEPKRHLKHLPPATYELLKDYPYPLLHAQILGFVHPITKSELFFDEPVPETFKRTLETLRERS